MKNWYCKPASKAEAIEIVERAIANGVVVDEIVSGMFTYGEQLTIQQVREQFPLPHEVNDMSDKKEWKGPQDGLPPVGTVCEVLCPDDEWHKTFIVGTDDDGYTVFTAHEFPDFYKYGGTRDAAAFRPLRTEREQWVSDAQKHCTEFSSNQIGKLYDALKSGALKAPEVE